MLLQKGKGGEGRKQLGGGSNRRNEAAGCGGKLERRKCKKSARLLAIRSIARRGCALERGIAWHLAIMYRRAVFFKESAWLVRAIRPMHFRTLLRCRAF
mmetsp:Transcript_128786/g.191965  ORF Transcript_128786/g.191965 Transcript_128786/m.191965 type:complete len:99 (+) Transcript_128786:553-849(+)